MHRKPRLPRLFDDIISLRRSVAHHIYRNQAGQILQCLVDKDRKLGVQVSWRRNLIRAQHLRRPDNKALWSIATGTYEPKKFLCAAHIIPAAFGKSLVRRIFGNDHDHHAFWAPTNALLLPKGLAVALDDWAVTIVPCDPDNPDYAVAARDLQFRVLDPHHEGLAMPLTSSDTDARRCRDSHGLRLQWMPLSDVRPAPEYLYFWHRCSAIAQTKRKGVSESEHLTEWWARLLGEVLLMGRGGRVKLDWGASLDGLEEEGAPGGAIGENRDALCKLLDFEDPDDDPDESLHGLGSEPNPEEAALLSNANETEPQVAAVHDGDDDDDEPGSRPASVW